MTENPIVSVVIPTYERPALVEKAVKSALAQTLTEIEVIVVTDGPDKITEESLSKVDDPRLKIFSLPFHQGANAARNRGIAEARAPWVALLDDDDEWLSTKLEEQLMVARNSKHKYPIVSCFMEKHSSKSKHKGFNRIPGSSEAISEFLLVPSGFFHKRGVVGTPSLFASKKIFERVPFKNNLRKCQDCDWVLRAVWEMEAAVEFVQKPLVIVHREEDRKRVSSDYDWKHVLNWIRANRQLVTPRAYAGFVLGVIADQALMVGEGKAFFILLREAFSFGKPPFSVLIHFFYKWLVPEYLRSRARLFKRYLEK